MVYIGIVGTIQKYHAMVMSLHSALQSCTHKSIPKYDFLCVHTFMLLLAAIMNCSKLERILFLIQWTHFILPELTDGYLFHGAWGITPQVAVDVINDHTVLRAHFVGPAFLPVVRLAGSPKGEDDGTAILPQPHSLVALVCTTQPG